ncbi:phage tail sheath family protein [Granulosicoccus antarcticus]|uniref:Uncharacterized protein n=1 Tax=Granulosicoccus antarcticus IMCC3135 TaxID=1192854 RepID=A0A2Z2NSM2_9GAMM|nr:phage tail sheath subtilisin-like domain-containing protein [Granulosicoccus antarcticus]ASJ74299.1 hypothetical protein IMCC3135_21110 [Granulosicoccus antarcticus IMCC3135]
MEDWPIKVELNDISKSISPIASAPTTITAFVGLASQGPVNTACSIHSWQEFENQFGTLSMESTMSFAVRDFFANGGRHAVIVRINDKDNENPNPTIASLDSLNALPVINFLCIPPPSFYNDIEDHVWRDAALYCEQRRALLIIDPPSSWTSGSQVVADMTAGRIINSPSALIYFPRLQQKNPLLDNQTQTFVPCGAVAGTIARMDEQTGVWNSPAGVSARIMGIDDLSASVSSSEYSQLNVLGVNCLRNLPRYGHVIWGARTLHSSNSSKDWKYLAVRRTVLHVEQSLTLWLSQIEFESNSEALWSEIRKHTNIFLYHLYQHGAFQGQSVEDVYFVRCDETTISLADISARRINLMVGLALLKPAEFVVITIRFKN